MIHSKHPFQSLITWLALGALIIMLLSGCGGSGASGSTAIINGSVMGGRQPISGSTVYIFASSASSVTGPVLIASATTTGNGTFSIASFFPNPSLGDLIYAVAIGGDAGGGTNPNATLMSLVGVYGSSLSHVQINELTSVAAVSQLNSGIVQVACNSISGNSSAASGTTCPSIHGQNGSWNSLANAITNLVSSSTGQVTTSDTAVIQNLNMQASVVANCVNSAGGTVIGTACGNLFDSALNSSLNPISGAPLAPLAPGDTLVSSAISPDGQYMFVVDSDASNVSIYSINASNGALSPIVGLPPSTGVNPSAITVSASGKYAYVTNHDDDTLSVYSIDSNGVLKLITQNSAITTDASPNVVITTPDDRFIYTLNSDGGSISAFLIDPTNGQLTEIGQSFTTGNSPGSGPYGMAISPDGNFIYNTNTTDNTVTTMAIDPATGALTTAIYSASTQNNPYSIVISPNGQFAYIGNADVGNTSISIFKINTTSGELSQIQNSPISTPIAVTTLKISPNGQFIYAGGNYSNNNNIYVYSINSGTGALTELTNSSFNINNATNSISISPNGKYVYCVGSGSSVNYAFLAVNWPADTLSALTNLQANASAKAHSIFSQIPVAPVFTPIPSSAPATLALP